MTAQESPDTGPGRATDDKRRLRALLDAAQSFGRMAVREHERLTGQGHWDPQVFRLFGVPAGDRPPHLDEALQRIDPQDLEHLRGVYRRSLHHPGRHEARYRVNRPDGSVAFLHSIWQVPEDDGRIVGVLIDDTDSVLQARRHGEQGTQLTMLSKLVGLSLWRTDLASQRIFRGGQAWSAAGLDPGHEGVPVAEMRALIHPEDLPLVDEASRRALSGAGASVVEARLRHPDGGYRRVLTRRVAQRDAQGQPVAMLGVGIDVTEQASTGERCRELRQRYELAVNATGTGVWSRHMTTGERDWNLQMRQSHGLGPDDPLPETDHGVTALVLPEDRALVRAAMDRVRRDGVPMAEISYRIRRADGMVRTLLGRVRRLVDRPEVGIGIVLDLTDLHEAQRAQRDKAAAEAGSRAKSEFLSRISHELRTPLNAVLGFSELLQSQGAERLTVPQREWPAHVRRAGQHLLGLVDDLLEISRESSPSAVDLSQVCDLTDVIEQVVARHADAARDAGVQVSVSGDCPQARGGQRHWRQVVTNLVSNAIKYNRPGGFVQIALRSAAAPGWLALDVRDNGRGIPLDQQRHLFEPFNRLGAERYGIQGTGLGLSIVHHLVQSMGGELQLHSRPGEGTRALLRAPRAEAADAGAGDVRPAPAPAPAADSAMPAAQPALAPADVVYVEDSPVNVLLVREFLARRPQLRLHVATGVADGVALVQRVRPALLLVNLHLPDGDGYDLLTCLSAGGGRPPRRCVALSADVVHGELRQAGPGGFDEHWAKPIDLDLFLAGIDRLLGAPDGGSA